MPTSLRAFFGTSERMYISAILIYVGIFLLAILRGRPLGAADHLYPDDLM
jgi:hypothetical protein